MLQIPEMKKTLIVILFAMTIQVSSAQLKLVFPSKDGLKITADWYPVSSNFPVILLCHQAGYSRGEYSETALRLNKLGFNCLALDQRSGDEINGIKNETAEEARIKKIVPSYADAEQDISAAVDYLFEKYKRPITIFGSSYSASLALKIATESDKVASVIVFSPGEYFEDKKYISSHIQTLTKPVFATSSLAEADSVTDLLKDINSRVKIQYIPASKGGHGAKVLWAESPSNHEYWIALMSFLNRIKTTE